MPSDFVYMSGGAKMKKILAVILTAAVMTAVLFGAGQVCDRERTENTGALTGESRLAG